MTRSRLLLLACAFATVLAGPARAQRLGQLGVVPAGTPPELERVGVTEHLDQAIPLDVPFRDPTGRAVTLRQYWRGDRPVVLTFAYHSCAVICNMVLNGVGAGLSGVGWTIGKEYDVVTISIDPDETPENTAKKRDRLLAEYKRPEARDGWHFLTGDKASIDRVASAAGFEYRRDEDQKNFAHPSVVMITKPNGQLARYLYGLEFPAADLKLGLLEASEGRSISTVEQLILYCYHYDPKGRKYVLVATRVMRVGGGLTATVLFGTLGLLWARERRKGGLLGSATTKDALTPDQVT